MEKHKPREEKWCAQEQKQSFDSNPAFRRPGHLVLPPAAHQLTRALGRWPWGSRRLMFISMMNGIPLGNLIFSLCDFGKTGGDQKNIFFYDFGEKWTHITVKVIKAFWLFQSQTKKVFLPHLLKQKSSDNCLVFMMRCCHTEYQLGWEAIKQGSFL